MTPKMPAREFLDACSVDPAVLELRPDYRGAAHGRRWPEPRGHCRRRRAGGRGADHRRRWDWRQSRRTALSDRTRSALFVLDGLDPVSNDQLRAAADALVEAPTALGAEVSTERLLLGAS
ncbi:hypothetical protein [Kocuria palustris]|uniref:hypothetical protein n=1 Tax=Kocuria palustris TaxID=71999 RepID=UPI0021A59CAA|nr:hypothetical protein [Kocuria palustris]MCT1589758.1 hypothetical protein [Kocuria palustris]